MIKQAEKEYSPEELEKKVQDFWKQSKAYEKTKDSRSKGKKYYFVDGPPYTTGSIHMGTAYNKILKDVIIRYRRMQGLNVRDQPGFDMHGLPIEVRVEKNLSIVNKKQIEDLVGVESFVNSCREFSVDLQGQMTDQFTSLGVWLDWDNPYRTIENKYIESAWWTIQKADEKQILDRYTSVLAWCPRCETAIADAEIKYDEVEDYSVLVKFLLKGRSGESLLVWTSTPWTLPANMAVAVNPVFEYAKVDMTIEDRKEILWLKRDMVDEVASFAGAQDFQILEIVNGSDMVGWEYFHPLASRVPYHNELTGEWIHKVLSSDLITDDNTGVVHLAPGHGLRDFEIGEAHAIPVFCPVDEGGYFTDEAGLYAGKHVRESNSIVIEDLRRERWLFHDGRTTNKIGHCWQCDSPVIHRASLQWFLKVSDFKERMLDEIEDVKWIPGWAGNEKQKEWVENAKDWCISRQRYWGIPFPIWACECGEMKVIGSVKELSKGKNYSKGMDLHRPWIDSVTFKCKECGNDMTRTPDVLDVWFDSGVCVWAQLGYPAVKKQFNNWWPCRWITEAQDQTKGWFYSLLVAGIIGFGEIPYKSVLMHGWVFDSQGQPLSKSFGDVAYPFDAIREFGADSLRFYMLKSKPPWDDLRYDPEEVKNANQTLNILWNVHRFGTLYMSMDKFNPNDWSIEGMSGNFSPEDHWLLSKVENLKGEVENDIEEFNIHTACEALEKFVLDDLSRWYVKLIRNRSWPEGDNNKKYAAYKALHYALLTVTKLMAPLTPHISESMYQSLDAGLLSVHMSDWPVADEALIDRNLEERMTIIQGIVELVSKARQKIGLKLRWPVKKIVIKSNDDETAKSLESLRGVLMEQTNSKEIEILWPGEEWDGMVLNVRPKIEAIGRVYKQWWSKIATMLESRPVDEVKKAIGEGEYKIGIEGQVIRIEPDMVEFMERLPEHVVSIGFDRGDMYIDMEMEPELKAEGFAREIVRRIQQMRKEIDLDVEDFIRTQVKVKVELTKMLEEYEDYISLETRSRSFEFVPEELTEEYIVEWNVEAEAIGLAITPLYMKETLDSFAKIPGIDEKESMALFDHGYASMLSLQQASVNELMEVHGIEELDARKIRRYFDQPEELRAEEKAICHVCEAEVDSGASECPRCGVSLQPEMQTCPNCEAQVPLDAEECESCGAMLVEKEVEEISEEVKEIMQIPGLGLETARMLNELGYDIDTLANTSEEDLVKVEGITVPLARKISVYFEEWVEELVCPLCNAPANADAEKCLQCGTIFITEEEAETTEEEPVSEVEEVEEVIEVPSFDEDVVSVSLERSHIYLVKEERHQRALDMFMATRREGRPGLCVTRTFPDKFKETFDVGDSTVLWLSNIGKDDSIRPKDLEKLSLSLEKFVMETGGVVLLDGLEYLITNNNFIIVLRLLQALRDVVAMNKSTMVVNVNPATLDSNQLNLLEREVDSVVDTLS
jgi:isoleucyl-tRNA synthetase